MIRVRSSQIVVAWACTLLGAVPAFAQVELSGSYAPRLYEDYIERGPGSDLGDYTGVPLNDEARARALLYEATIPSMIERQCLALSPWVGLYRPLGLRIYNDVDESGRVVAWKLGGDYLRDTITIWMDGRPRPSANAWYPPAGFTTGTLGRRYARRRDHAHQDHLAAPRNRHPRQRSDDDHRVHHAARGHADDHDDPGGPDLPHRASRRQPRVANTSRAATRAGGLRVTPPPRSRGSRTRGSSRTICPARTRKRTS